MLLALGGYVLVWTLYGVIAKSSQDLHNDMTELIAWSRDLALGYPKHPPLAATIVRGWFAFFPIADWTYYLLGIVTAATTLWIAWLLFADYLDAQKRLIAVALLTFIPFYNFHALKFNINTVQIPFWAITSLWFLRSYRTRSAGYAALAGAAAAFSMLGKYWSGCLLAGLAVAAVCDPRRGDYFRSPAPWITVLTGLAVLSPHLAWLERHHFVPLQYAAAKHGGLSTAEAIAADFTYVIDLIGYACVAIAIVFLAARPNTAALVDMILPRDRERRLVAVALWATLLVPALLAPILGVEINGLWMMPGLTLLPILLLDGPSIKIPTASIRIIVGSAVVLPLLMLLAAPAVAIVFHERGFRAVQAQVHLLAEQVEKAWRATTAEPLRYVGGDYDLANGVLTYASDRPVPLPKLPARGARRIRQFGAALVCVQEDLGCTATITAIAGRNAGSRKITVQLARTYLGIVGEPQDYLIFIVPPTAKEEADSGHGTK